MATNSRLISENNRFLQLYRELENAAVCIAICPAGDVMQSILKILFKGDHHAK